MADASSSKVWIGRSVFVILTVGIIFAQILPLDTRPTVWAPPDWLLAVTLVWVARRPDFAPVWIVAAIFLLADLLFQRPPGLWAAMVVILTEMLRARTARIREMPFAMAWGWMAMGVVAITIINRVVQTLVMSVQAPLALSLIQMVMTIIFIPLVVLIAQFIFGVSRPTLGQVDSRGQRL